jgi:RNA polymerase sigma-70 factor (ECF subfamily)
LNAIRSRKTERGIFDRSEDVGDASVPTPRHPERTLEARDELRQLRAALATLSPQRAEAVLLHDALGYDLAEVAALTSSTPAAVQSRLSRGRRDLQERLGLGQTKEGA